MLQLNGKMQDVRLEKAKKVERKLKRSEQARKKAGELQGGGLLVDLDASAAKATSSTLSRIEFLEKREKEREKRQNCC
jgi:hypothetical protein